MENNINTKEEYKGLELKEDFCDNCQQTTNFLNGYCEECGDPDMQHSFSEVQPQDNNCDTVEQADILKYAKDERLKVSKAMQSDWLKLLPKERVAIEDFLICHDNMFNEISQSQSLLESKQREIEAIQDLYSKALRPLDDLNPLWRKENDEPDNVLPDTTSLCEWTVEKVLSMQREVEELVQLLSRLKNQSEDKGREGCTYNDTNFDSLSVVYGWNLALQQMKEFIAPTLSKHQQ